MKVEVEVADISSRYRLVEQGMILPLYLSDGLKKDRNIQRQITRLFQLDTSLILNFSNLIEKYRRHILNQLLDRGNEPSSDTSSCKATGKWP